MLQSICIINHLGHLGLDSRLVSPQLNKFICQFHISLTWHFNRFRAKINKEYSWLRIQVHASKPDTQDIPPTTFLNHSTPSLQVYTVESCLMATLSIQPPCSVAHGTLFRPKQKLTHSFSYLKNHFNVTRFLWPVGDRINGVSLYSHLFKWIYHRG